VLSGGELRKVSSPALGAVLPHVVRMPMRITSKGQVTIPQDIRDELGLLPNTEVTFDVVDGEARLRKARRGTRSRGNRVVARLRSVPPSNKLTTDEIMALMRGKP
jgi:AbrB family looped-hinge helix DNA binding protein